MDTKFWYQFKLTRALYILIIICLGLASCEPYEPDVQVDKSIVVELEIAPNEDPKARVHLTNSIVDPKDFFYYPKAEAELMLFPIGGDSLGRLPYALEPGCYTSPSMEIEEGESYYLQISVPQQGVGVLEAETKVPFADKLESVTIEDSSFQLIGNIGKGTLNFTVEMPEAQAESTYYHLIPSIINAEEAALGNIVYDDFLSSEIKILSNDNGIRRLIHKNGIFIDNSKLVDNIIGLELEYSVSAEFNIEDVDSVAFTLRTINNESMVYHDNTDRELRIINLPLDDPPISSDNIINGYGLFGAYSTHRIAVAIR